MNWPRSCRSRRGGKAFEETGGFSERLVRWYEKGLDRALAHQRLTLGVFGLTLALAVAATLAMTRFKLGMGATLAGCAGLGWAVRMATQSIM